MLPHDLPRAWNVDDVKGDASWSRHLSAEAVAGLNVALDHAKKRGKPWLSMTSDDFPLNEAARTEILNAYRAAQGRWGFCLLKGFPVAQWSTDDAALAFWSIGLHMGVARTQSKASSLMSHVRDTGNTYKRKNGRGYDTNAKLDFHTDSCDVAGLLCLKRAKSGGVTKITSSIAIVDEIKRVRPDLIAALKQAFYYSQLDTQAATQLPYYHAPLLGSDPDYFGFRTNRKNITLAQAEFAEIPRLAPEQIDALEFLEDLMPDPRFCYSMMLEPGDLQLVNNYVVLHSRTEFEDYEEEDRKRHLLRLWLAVPDAQRLPPEWGYYYGDTRGGTVRGGLRGSGITPEFLEFEQRQARRMGMPVAERFQAEYDAMLGTTPANAATQ